VKGVEDGSIAELRLLVVGRRMGTDAVKFYDSLHQPQTRMILLEGKNAFFDVVVRSGLHPPPLGREMQALDFFFDSMDLLIHFVRETEFVFFQVEASED